MASLSHSLESTLRTMVVEGALAPGARINEVHLARELDVSRTPLREALTRLVGEAFLESRPRFGFFVRRLTATELASLYEVRQRLDPWALGAAGLPGAARLAELRALNRRIVAAAGDVRSVVELDDEWHLLLVRDCPNTVLLELIRQMMWRTRRYEYVYLDRGEHVEAAGHQHETIIAALAAGDLDAGCDALRANMLAAVEPLTHWIEAQT